MVDSSCARHGFAPNRLRLIATASGLMTESASRSSRSTHASTPDRAPEHAAMLRRGDSRLGGETPVNGASRANPEFRRGTVTRRWLGNLRGGAHARPSAFSLPAARRRLSPAGRSGLLAASRDRREFPPAAPAPPFPNPPFQRVEEPSALGPRHQSAARARLSRQGKAGPRSPTVDRDCCPPPQLGHRNRVPCVLRRSSWCFGVWSWCALRVAGAAPARPWTGVCPRN